MIGVTVVDAAGIHNKNPIHPCALTLEGVTVGREVIRFNLSLGIQAEGEIVAVSGGELHLRLADGRTRVFFLDDLGIIPSKGGWNQLTFVIDAADRDKLPPVIPTQRRFGVGLFSDDPDHSHYHGEPL